MSVCSVCIGPSGKSTIIVLNMKVLQVPGNKMIRNSRMLLAKAHCNQPQDLINARVESSFLWICLP
jgi:hypothetical protein